MIKQIIKPGWISVDVYENIYVDIYVDISPRLAACGCFPSLCRLGMGVYSMEIFPNFSLFFFPHRCLQNMGNATCLTQERRGGLSSPR